MALASQQRRSVEQVIYKDWADHPAGCYVPYEVIIPKRLQSDDVLGIGNGFGAGSEEIRKFAVRLAQQLGRRVVTYDDPRVREALDDPMGFRKQTHLAVLEHQVGHPLTLAGWSTGGYVDTEIAHEYLMGSEETRNLDVRAVVTLGMAGIVKFSAARHLARRGGFEVMRAPLSRVPLSMARKAIKNSPQYFLGRVKLELAAKEVEALKDADALHMIRSVVDHGGVGYRVLSFEHDGIFSSAVSTQILNDAGLEPWHQVLEGVDHIELAWNRRVMDEVAVIIEEVEQQGRLGPRVS